MCSTEMENGAIRAHARQASKLAADRYVGPDRTHGRDHGTSHHHANHALMRP